MRHPQIVFPGAYAPLFDGLARPLDDGLQLDPARQPKETNEVSLTGGWYLQADDWVEAPHGEFLKEKFHHFLSGTMQAPAREEGYRVLCRRGAVPETPAGAVEAYRVTVSAQQCEIVAADEDGWRRALFFLEDEMRLRRAPILPVGEQTRWAKIKTRITRSPVAPYRWLSGWELDDDTDYYPEEYLNRLAHYGINGLWVPGLFRNLVASQVIPELGPAEHNLDRLKALIAKAARHGIRVYLFIMEPRALPPGHPAGLVHPEILGAGQAHCPSVPLVLEYVREVTETLFREVPDLAGLINIFCGERLSNCWMNPEYVQACPRCRERSRAEVHGEILDAFIQGIRAADSPAEFIGWTYLVGKTTEALPITPMVEVMQASRPEVIWLGNFEHGFKKSLFGREVTVNEYSMTCVGPSSFFRDLAVAARDSGRQIYAKFQMGTTFEMSSVPYIPVPPIAYEKLSVAASLGVTGSLFSWIIGGFPGPMLQAAGEAVFEPRLPEDDFLLRQAAISWGEAAAPDVVAAWKIFAEAWQLYPVHNSVLLWGPLTRAPAYHLHLEQEPRLAKPYNWGLNRNREPQPFEDQTERWRGFAGQPFYSVDEVTSSFRAIAKAWRQGLDHLEHALRIRKEPDLHRQFAVAAAIRLQCLATANVYEFYDLRDRLKTADAETQTALLRRMLAVANDELNHTREMKNWIGVEPSIGFQSEIYDFSYSLPLLDAKLIQVERMRETLQNWQKYGVDQETLTRTVEEVEFARPDADPDRWGD